LLRYLSELDRALVVEATRQTHRIWSGGRTPESYTAFILEQLDLAGPDLLRYAGLVDQTGLVASMKRYGVMLSGPGGRPLPAIGIGAVFTREDARGRGHAAALLTEALGEARASGVAAAWLHAEIDPRFYERLGFISLPGLSWRASAADLPDAGALSLRPPAQGDLDRLLGWREASFAPDPAELPHLGPWLRPARTAAIWRYFAFRNGVQTWILEDAGRDAGYLAASPGKGKLWVDEWAAPSTPLARILATLRAFAQRNDLPAVAGWLRPDQGGPPFESSPRDAGVPMIALLSSPWTEESIDPARVHFGSFEYF
jgi:GNAT superfamily N-acetyltransferase